MNNSQIENVRTIRVSDLFLAVCQRWRALLIWLVIGALVLGAYGWWENTREEVLKDSKAAKVLEDLDDDRRGAIEAYASEYVAFVKQIAKQSEYNKTAPLMQLDPYQLNGYELKYYIYNESGEMEDGSEVTPEAIAQGYIAQLHTEFLRQRVETGKEKEINVLPQKEDGSANLLQIDLINIKSGILTFRIYSKDDLLSEDASSLKEYIQSAYGNILKRVGEHSILLVGESSFITEDMDILKTQTANLQRVEDLTLRLSTIQSNVTDADEKQYLNYLIQKELQDENASNKNKFFRRISKKMILLGAILGLVLAAIVIIIKYITTETIKTDKELEEDLDLQVLGQFYGKDPFYQKRKTRLDRWLHRIRNRKINDVSDAEMVELVATKIRIEAEKRNLDQVCVIVDGNVIGRNDFIDAVLKKVGEKPSIKVITNILEQSKDLEVISDMDGAVLVSQIGRSRFDDIQSICKLCANYQVDMIGSIVLD